MKVAGIFAGIGGLELGLGRSGHHASLLCEIDSGAQAVLRARFPGVELARDVCRLRDLPAEVELVCGGFPCQDLSQAGRTAGLAGEQSSLIGEVFRLLERRPVPWVVLENVPFMLQLNKGGAMAAVVKRLGELRYRWAYRVVNTMAFGLPQRRERVYIVASRDRDPGEVLFADQAEPELPTTKIGEIAHGFYWTEGIRGLGWAPDAIPTLKNGSTIGIPSPPAILMPNGSIVKPDIRDAERIQGFEEDWTSPAEEVVRASRRWSLVGNAVSVPVADWIGRRLASPGAWDRALARPLEGGGWPRAAASTRDGIVAVNVSSFPVAVERPHLAEFLRHPGALLSLRATAGFFGRTKVAKLRFPEGFLSAVENHLLRMSGDYGAEAAE